MLVFLSDAHLTDGSSGETIKPTATGPVRDKVYFNTGTWRKTWNKVLFDPANREFIGWHVLTYVAVFRPEENGPYNFEVWNGALG